MCNHFLPGVLQLLNFQTQFPCTETAGCKQASTEKKSVDQMILIPSSGNGQGQLSSFHAKCPESVPGERAD